MKRFVVVVLAMGLVVGAVRGQQIQPAQGFDGPQRYVVTSVKNRTPYQIDSLRVDSTIAPVPEGFRLPVIYVLDGNSLFPLVGYLTNAIVSFSKEVPAALVVSIGYANDPSSSRADNVKKSLTLRLRDLSPAATHIKTPPPGSGGAAEFLAFITDELKPFIAARYLVNPQDQTLVGHSLGGLFTVYALLTSPQLFTRYVAASPSVFWDDHALIKQAASLTALPGPGFRKLFVSVGGLETKERMGEGMIGDAQNLVSVLQRQNVAGLDVAFQLFPDENHISVIPAALGRGLGAVQALR